MNVTATATATGQLQWLSGIKNGGSPNNREAALSEMVVQHSSPPFVTASTVRVSDGWLLRVA